VGKLGGGNCAPPINSIIHLSINPVAGWSFFVIELAELARVLVALGCPAEKSADMAAQLDRRACQLAVEKGCGHDAALQHLLTLMRQGWAAREKGI